MLTEWSQIHTTILELEQAGVVTRTFRRLDPQRQQVIVHAILDEAQEKGPASINIKKVAERAGVALGSLYQYFGNREGLLDFSTRVCVYLLTSAFDQFRPMLAALPLREALTYYLTGGIEWSKTQVGLIQFFGRAAYQGDPLLAEKVVRPVADAMRMTMFEILQAAQQRGEIHADRDLDVTARVVNAWMIALGDSQLLPYLNNYFQVTAVTVPFERAIASAVELLVCGLGQPDGGTA